MAARTWSVFEAAWALEGPTFTKRSSRDQAGPETVVRSTEEDYAVVSKSGAPVLRWRSGLGLWTRVESRGPLSMLESEPIRERAAARRRVLSAGVDSEGFIMQRKFQLGNNNKRYRRKLPMAGLSKATIGAKRRGDWIHGDDRREATGRRRKSRRRRDRSTNAGMTWPRYRAAIKETSTS